MKSPDPKLVLLAQHGDRQALDALLRGCQASLFRYVESLLGHQRDGAEDVLQETLLRIVRKLRWLDDPRFFRAWSLRIASREAFRALGKRRPGVALDEVDPAAPAVEPPALDARETRRLRTAVAALPPASRAVVSLHYFADLPLDEVADILGIPLGTVKSRLSYGLGRLRREPEVSA